MESTYSRIYEITLGEGNFDFFNCPIPCPLSLKFCRGVKQSNPLMEISSKTSVISSRHRDKLETGFHLDDMKLSRVYSRKRCFFSSMNFVPRLKEILNIQFNFHCYNRDNKYNVDCFILLSSDCFYWKALIYLLVLSLYVSFFLIIPAGAAFRCESDY